MPRQLPSDWTKEYLQANKFILVVEVFRDPDLDADWGTTEGVYGNERVSFWSHDLSALRTAQTNHTKWIFTDRLVSFGTVQHRKDDRELGGIGSTSSFSFVLNNKFSSSLGGSGGWPDFLTQLENERTACVLENRPARVCLMRNDNTQFVTGMVPVLAGRLTKLEPRDRWTVSCTIEGTQLQADIEVPTKVWTEGERINNILVVQSAWGQPKPWLFGNVPYAAGRVVVDSYKFSGGTTLEGKLVLFADDSETWQDMYDLQELFYGDSALVDSADPPGLCRINTASGGWAGGPRSAHTKLSDNTGYYFDDHNQQYLYLKLDILFRLQDDVTTSTYNNPTNPENLIDRDPDTDATYPATSVSAAVATAQAAATLAFPNCNGFSMRIEGTTSNNWEALGGGGATNDYGVYVFWEGDEGGNRSGTNAWIGIWLTAGFGGSWVTDYAEGPAYFFKPSGGWDNYDLANRENYRMSQRPSTAGLGGTPDMNMSAFEVRQGSGRYFAVGCFCQASGSGSISAGVTIARVGLRLWGRIDFPDTGFIANADGYARPLGNNYSVAFGTLVEKPADVALMVFREATKIAYPGLYYSAFTSLFQSDFKVGRQVTSRTDVGTLLDELYRDSAMFFWAGDDHSNEVATGTLQQGVYSIPMAKLQSPCYTFSDVKGPTDSGVIPGSVSPKRTPVQDVWTRFEFKWGYSGVLSDYAHTAVFSATEAELGDMAGTTHATAYLTAALQTELGQRADRYARPSDKYTLRYEATWIQDHNSAAYLLAFLIRNRSKRRRIVTLETSMAPIKVRMGDTVQVDLKDLPESWCADSADDPWYMVYGVDINMENGRIRWVLVEIEPLSTITYLPVA